MRRGAAQDDPYDDFGGDALGTEATQVLLQRAEETGFLTQDDLVGALAALDLDPTQLDEVYRALEDLAVDVVEEAGPAAEVEVVSDLDLSTREISTDALQLFLKDIGKVRLLTAAQEIELAKRIERGDHRA